MSSNLALKQATKLALDSREVAEMVGKRHDNLVRDIETYIEYLGHSSNLRNEQSVDLRPDDFFIGGSYKAGTGREYKCFQITKKGCELIAHKLTGKKGVLFTAAYINKFHDMEKALVGIYDGKPVAIKKEEQEKLFIQKQRAEAMLLNARTRQAKLILEMRKTGNLSPIAVELLGISAVEALMGETVDYRPETEKTYSATDIAEEAGVSANMVGRAANRLGLKTSEYGITVLDKSRHSDKQVSSFRYNEKGRMELIKVFKNENGSC